MALRGARALGALLCLAVAACAIEPVEQLVWNRTDTAVTVYLVSEGQERVLYRIEPGIQHQLHLSGTDCPALTLIARTAAGDEVARHTEPFCPNDTWEIK